MPEDNYLMQKKFDIVIDANNKKIFNEMNKIIAMVNRLDEEINSIKRRLDERPVLRTEHVETQKEGQTQLKKESDSQPQRPKPGDYSPEEVAVDKIFYFGKK